MCKSDGPPPGAVARSIEKEFEKESKESEKELRESEKESKESEKGSKDIKEPKKSKESKFRSISRSELLLHSSPDEAWCAVHGAVLSISDFSRRHPGGDLILLAAGKDATVLFETYHPRGVPEALVKKLQIGTMEAGAFPTSFYSWDSTFYGVLKRRVVARLEERSLERRGSLEIWIKAAFLLAGFWYCLYKMCMAPQFGTACLYAVTMGAFASFVGTCIQHDGNHGAFAYSRTANKLAGWTLDMIGASAFTWELQHMLGHHPYTNVLDVDAHGDVDVHVDVHDDVSKPNLPQVPEHHQDQESDPDVFSSFPLMKMHPHHTPRWFHAYQHIYAPLLFALMTLGKVLQQDFEVVTSKRLYHIDAQCRYGSKLNVARFWIMKLLTFIYMLAAPVYFHGLNKGLALFIIGHCACGELLATFFIVNHVIEGVSYASKTTGGLVHGSTGEETHEDTLKLKRKNKPVTASGDTPMEQTRKLAEQYKTYDDIPSVPFNDWAAVQCQTSVNWSVGSWFWNHVSGGLCHQIEHHLFPSVCHTNYVYFQDVVEDTCKEYGVPYQSEPNLWVAYGKMVKHLRRLGSAKAE